MIMQCVQLAGTQATMGINWAKLCQIHTGLEVTIAPKKLNDACYHRYSWKWLAHTVSNDNPSEAYTHVHVMIHFVLGYMAFTLSNR